MSWLLLRGVYLIVVTVGLATNSFAAISLDWEIGNRFRAFDFLAGQDPKKSKEYFEFYAPKKGTTLEDWLGQRSKDPKTDRGRGISPFSEDRTGAWVETPRDGSHPRYEKALVHLPEHLYLTVKLKTAQEDGELPSGECEVFLETLLLGKGACDAPIHLERVPATKGTLSVQLSNTVIARDPSFEPKLKVVLGIGDSYGAGEGSPDQPTLWRSGVNENWVDKSWFARPLPKRTAIQKWVDTPASWISNRCNRSFFSAQSMVALKMAVDEPQNIISFVHLSCAGAEVIDGLLAPQRLPPGAPTGKHCEDVAKKPPSREVDSQCDVTQAQLAAAVDLLCLDDKIDPLSSPEIDAIRSRMRGIKSNPKQLDWITNEQRHGLHWCPVNRRIIPSLVLLQVGGNDVGFSRLVAWALLPIEGHKRNVFGDFFANGVRKEASVICPRKWLPGCIPGQLSVEERIGDLAKRYDALAFALDLLLGVKHDHIVLPGYPNPLQDSNGSLCGNPAHKNLDNEWTVAKVKLPQEISPSKWQFNLTARKVKTKKKGEADLISEIVIPQLNAAIYQATIQKDPSTEQPRGWRYVDVADVMHKSGWCTSLDGDYKGLLLPTKDLPKWDAFANHVRKIRTSNDSAMSQWPSDQRDDWLSGTFHPNAWGYAAIATQMLEVMH